jgi:DNA-binding winged helix-turn-helix (wHTH) protein
VTDCGRISGYSNPADKFESQLPVLAALLERPGEIVTREELRSKLWSADTFVDFDHSLNAAIKRLRDALGESAETPIFIETLARRGYRDYRNPTTATPHHTTPHKTSGPHP